MLQISTGKFFDTTDLIDTTHRGVLYSNFQLLPNRLISTSAGKLYSAARWGDIETLVCDVYERQPNVIAPGSIISVGPDAFINDFAAVSSFALQRLLTPDRDLAVRLLTAKRPPLGIPKLPKEYVSGVFDMSPPHDPQAESRLSTLVSGLLELDRKSFSGAIRAIRRYVTAMHRLADDLDLAYSLFVAAIESLAQDFDKFAPVWGDYDSRKRDPIEKALAGASPEVARAVQDAILGVEHTALNRRFREFSLKHLGPEFFREQCVGRIGPAGRTDIDIALKNAYRLRSGYIHTLQSIPRLLASPLALTELMLVDGTPYLTFEGLARVARTVIVEFIHRAPKVDKEKYDYFNDFPNMLRMPMAPSMWIHQAESYSSQSAYIYLNGFLQEVERSLLKPSEPITDIRGVTTRIEGLLKSLAKPTQRRPLVTLYYWFSHFLPREERNLAIERQRKYIDELNQLSPESLFLYVFEGRLPPWPAVDCRDTLNEYFRNRYKKNHLNAGALLGAAAALTISEMYRLAEDEAEAKNLVAWAVDEFPEIGALREFEATLQIPLQPIIWWSILVPSPDLDADSSERGAGRRFAKLNERLRNKALGARSRHRRKST